MLYVLCYQNKDNDTVNDWITEVKNKGLNCIAVTDHNDYREIDEIKKLGEENNIVVFPGVELSCDTSKIHILVLFDIDCDGNTVQEFLNQLKIFKSNLGDSGHTADGDIFHACETAQSMGALVIPAHIDEFSGLSDMSHDNICKLLDRKYINIKELPQCLSEKDAALNNLVSKALEISNSKRIILDKPRLETELLDIESQISKYEKSGISDTLKEKQLFDDQEKALLSYIDRKKNKIDEIKKYLDEVVIAYDDVTDSEIKSLLEEDLNEFKLDINRLNQFCNEMLSKNDKLFEKLDNTEWKKKRIAIQNKYVSVMQNLQDNGLDTVKLDTLMEQRNNKKEEIDRILIKEKQLCKLEEEYESLESVYRNKVDIIYKLRNNFIQEVIGNDKNVKFQLAKNRNRNSFINNLKAIMQKEITSVDDDINELADLYFKKEDGIEKYKKMLISIRNKEDQKSLSKKTRDIITSIAEDSFARMIAFIPDDDLIVSYRPEKAKKFIPLSNASAGQKTTTILTFLLAYGNQPLLLDQPEDDLDNRLVYDLIVARLKVAKSKRQIIVVTHNANIPVNGDSEYIISMDSETDIIQVNQTGTMDDESMRQEICDVMEGTKDAFEMRAKKYHFNIKE